MQNFINPQVFQAPGNATSHNVQGPHHVQSTQGYTPIASNFKNPFMMNQGFSAQQGQTKLGVNEPFKKAVFLGYRDDKALYGGSRLFVLG